MPAQPEGTRDGVSIEGRLVVATARGVRTPGEAHLLRFGEAEITTMTLHGEHVAIGTDDGSILLVAGSTGEAIRFEGAGAVSELASDGGRLYVGTSSGLVVWDGEQAKAVSGVGQVTAMAAGREGVAVGTATGEIWLAEGGGVKRLPARVDDRVSALAWDGESLLVGTPFALLRVTGDNVRTVRRDLSVTAILVDDQTGGACAPPPPAGRPSRDCSRVYLGTFDDGVVRIEADGREHRLVGREHVRRLRWIDGRPVAFGDGGAWDLSGPAASRLV